MFSQHKFTWSTKERNVFRSWVWLFLFLMWQICWINFINPFFLSTLCYPLLKHTHTHTHTHIYTPALSSQSTFWLLTNTSELSHQYFLRVIDFTEYSFITSNSTKLVKLTMFPRSVSVEQAKKVSGSLLFFPPLCLTPPLESEQKAYCQVDRPGQNVTVCPSRAQRYI
jgi:hypothetical protein